MNQKHIYGAYLNMARQNAFITLSHISKLLGDSGSGQENNLSQMKAVTILINKKTKVEEKDRALKLLHKHFPFLKPMVDNELGKLAFESKGDKGSQIVPQVGAKEYHQILVETFETLNLLRNQYSHYQYKDSKVEHPDYIRYNQNIGYRLKRSFEGGRRIVKERFTLDDNNLKFIIDNIRKPETYKDENNRNKKRFVEDETFFYKLDTQNKALSSKGIVFFICLFLEKKYISQFLDSSGLNFYPIRSNKKEEEKKNQEEEKIIREIFSVFRIRLPRTRIESNRHDSALALDILNELKKCPSELFEILEKENQDEFRLKVEKSEDSEHAVGDEILMMRYNDRFQYFVLRYIDDNKIFEDIRFQVALGKYRYKFYDKQGIDSSDKDRVRILQKELNGFGRLSEIEEERKKRWADLIRPFEDIKQDTVDENPYITEHRASYMLNANKIGLAFNPEGKTRTLNNGIYLPTISPPKENKEYDAEEVENKAPTCWLSLHELLAMIFHHQLSKKHGVGTTEKIIKNYVEQYYKLFQDIKEGKLTPSSKQNIEKILAAEYEIIKYKDIPEKLQKYLTNQQEGIEERFKTLSCQRIEKMIEWTDRRIEKFREEKKMIGQKENKLGKNSYIDIRPGRLARFLSEDIVLMQPTTNHGKNKPTGMNFQIIQSSLAIYEKSIGEFKRMFVSAGLIGGSTPHPFLIQIIEKKPKDCLVFYELYLKERKIYLQKELEKKDFRNTPFLYANRRKWQKRNETYYKELANRYLNNNPIELPRGLFANSIKEILASKYADNQGMKAALAQERVNITYLIAKYFEHIYDDSNQGFYNYKRSYELFDKLVGKIENRNQLAKQHYTSEELVDLSVKEKLEERIEKYTYQEAEKEFDTQYTAYNTERDQRTRKVINKTLNKGRSLGLRKDAIKKFKLEDFSQSKEVAKIYQNLLKRITKNEYLHDDDLKDVIVYWEESSIIRKMEFLLRDYKKNEKLIRQYRVQDMLLFLMAKDMLLAKEFENNELRDFRLKNVSLNDGKDNILSLQIPFEVTLKLKDGVEKTIKQDSLKLKNYGDFFQFLYDDRIKTLLPQVEDATIDRALLEKELENYNLRRTDIFKLSLEYEKYLLDVCKIKVEKESPSFREIVQAKEDRNEEQSEKLIRIRNAFSHNHYNTEEIVKTDKIPNVAVSMKNKMEKLTKKRENK